MFKILLLGQWYNLSDRKLASCIKLRLDLMYFINLAPTDNLPDYTTINKFRNLLIRKNKLKKLFQELNKQLELLGLKINSAKGAIINATLVESAARPNKHIDNIPNDRNELDNDYQLEQVKE